VLLGVLFAGEQVSVLQVVGLVIILISVLLINLVKYRKTAPQKKVVPMPGLKTAELLVKAC
jgi:drug/metabolite transporter (DMT)-like permease